MQVSHTIHYGHIITPPSMILGTKNEMVFGNLHKISDLISEKKSRGSVLLAFRSSFIYYNVCSMQWDLHWQHHQSFILQCRKINKLIRIDEYLIARYQNACQVFVGLHDLKRRDCWEVDIFCLLQLTLHINNASAKWPLCDCCIRIQIIFIW